MNKITVTGFVWAPPFAQGIVRDLRVRWALEEAGLPYEVNLIRLEERHAYPYLHKNPFGMVPAFEADGHGLFKSGAIVHEIALDTEVLMPTDRKGRANTLTWMFAALNTVEPPIANLATIDLTQKDEQWAKLRRPTVVESVKARLGTLSNRLEGREYLLDHFTAADILMVGVLRLLRHCDLVAEFPVVHSYLKRCEARPAFQKALSAQMADFAKNVPAAA